MAISQHSGEPRGRGRPRSRDADRSILRAALDLLADNGLAALTMEGLAARAGVGKATVYRRWQSPLQVLVAAVADFVEEIRIPDTGSIREDLLLLMTKAVEVYRGRAGRMLPGLLAAMAADTRVADSVRSHFLKGRREALATVLRRAVARGELRADLDTELALDFLGGPLFYRVLVTGGPLDTDLATGVVDTLLRGLVPRTANADELENAP